MSNDDAGTSPAGEGRRSSFPGRTVRSVAGTPTAAPPHSAVRKIRRVPAVGGRVAPDGRQVTRPARLVALLGATGGGLTTGVFGTLLHAHILSPGGTGFPLGAVGSLVLAFCVFLLCGLWSRNVLMTAVAGAAAYVVVAVLSTSRQPLILTGSSDAAPAVSFAGNLWLFGVVAMTLAAVAATGLVLRRSRQR